MPFQVNGTAFEQTVVSTLTATVSMTVTFSVIVESQPAADVVVYGYCPAPGIVMPFQVNGTALEQTVVSIATAAVSIVLTLIVRIVSQPLVLLTVSVTEPGALNRCPRIVAGKAFAQTAVSIVVVRSGSSVTLIVRTVSQPLVLLTVSVTLPGWVNTCPKRFTGNAFAQTAVSIVIV